MDRLAAELKIAGARQWSTLWRARFVRAVQRKEHQELCEWHLKTNSPGYSLPADKDKLAQAVFLQSQPLEKRGQIDSGQLKQISYGDLRPAQKRAVDLIAGAKPKAKKNPIETEAVKISSSIKQYLNEAAKHLGRPEGSRTSRVRAPESEVEPYMITLSLSDICDAVVPLIEKATGVRLTARRNDVACDVLLAVIDMYLSIEDGRGNARAVVARELSRLKPHRSAPGTSLKLLK
jgi:hypothetical protein